MHKFAPRFVLAFGGFAICCGMFIHGLRPDPLNTHDRQRMMYGAAVAVSGVVALGVGMALRRVAREALENHEG